MYSVSVNKYREKFGLNKYNVVLYGTRKPCHPGEINEINGKSTANTRPKRMSKWDGNNNDDEDEIKRTQLGVQIAYPK